MKYQALLSDSHEISISYESSARQRIHTKDQASFSVSHETSSLSLLER